MNRIFYTFVPEINLLTMFVNRTTLLLCVVLLAIVAGCSKSYVDPAIQAAAENDAAIKQYNTDSSLNAQQLASGLYYVIRKANPTGKLPVVGDEVGYTYKLSTLKNVKVDQQDTTIYSPYGSGELITDQLFERLRVGEYGVFLLPNYLAFGSQAFTNSSGATILPAYSAVRYDIRLLSSLTEDEQIDQYITRQNLTVTEKTATGLRLIKTVTKPTAATLTTGQTVKVNYSGRLIRGITPFDPGPTFTLILGQNQVVPGFEEGIRKLQVGEKATIIFPSAQGYGVQGRKNSSGVFVIPPYAPLIFVVEVVSAQ